MIKIIIADDHPISREGIKKIIAKSHDIIVADEAGTGEELLEKVKKNRYDVIILDVSMPGSDGLEVLRDLQNPKYRCPVLVFSMYPEEQYAVRALKAGASGYLTKGSDPEELMKAIKKVSDGGKYISMSLAEKLANDISINNEQPLHEKLSDREFQVMTMLASGKSIKAIASQLFLSVPTISTYRSRVLQKMSMKNNAELIHYAIKNNLI
ncbi:MAG TPA: DNA-binding response regulator [Nitrospiraceae bacterium]|nr:DNA-binding response regulator [Nitrospiraceae bacterium]